MSPSVNFLKAPDCRPVILRRVKNEADLQEYARLRTGVSGMHKINLGTLSKTIFDNYAFIARSAVEVTLGTASFWPIEPLVASVGIYIVPEMRGNGWGRALLAEIEKEPKDAGFIAIRADIFEDNVDALKFFKGGGYKKFQYFEKALV